MSNVSELTSLCVNDIGHGFFVKFSSLKTNRERVDYLSLKISEQSEIRKKLDIFADVVCDKSIENALKFKQLGNKLFQGKKYEEALGKYNEGIGNAPFGNNVDDNDKEFAILLANRSACLFYCKKFEQSLADIEAALHNGYPENMAYKIWHRGGKCLVSLHRETEAKEYFNRGLESLNMHSGLEEKMKQKWNKTFENDLKQLVGADVNKGSKSKDQTDFKLEDKDCVSTSFSGGLSVGVSEVYGRYVYANKDLQIGSVVAEDQPFSCTLLPDFNLSHCTECCSRITVPFPCKQCNNILYCSYLCQRKSWQNYHKYECHVLSFFSSESCGRLGHLAARTFVLSRKNWINQFKILQAKSTHEVHSSDEKESKNEILATDLEVDDCGSDIMSKIEQLQGHESNFRDGHTDLHMALMALYLKNVLYETNLFEDTNIDLKLPKNPAKLFEKHSNSLTKQFDSFVAEKLLTLIQIIQCNGFSVPEMQYLGEVKHSIPEDIAMALYPNMAFFNHSCDPDLELCFQGNKVKAVTIKEAYKGDQICVDYGYVFYSDRKGKRRSDLKMQYLFDCNCTACNNNWPMFDDMDSKIPTFKCTKCRNALDLTKQNQLGQVICDNPCCDHADDLQTALTTLAGTHKNYSDAVSQLELDISEISYDKSRYEEALPYLIKHLSTMSKYLCQPWKEFYSCQVMIKQCYRLMGNVHVAKL